ncbi:UNVERIFIED_CONTAM: hypothetical protein Sradi_5934800 [Sesamum radiatum]|uniref:Uncharacterized protein n=1 Tax=Sesamum radiatum TaxID=300843 RepID=A0AAW2KVD2_SESRA
MEGGKQSGSSFASDLFGAKDSSAAASSSGIFGSIFPPPPKVIGQESVRSSEADKKNDSGNPSWSAKSGVSDNKAVVGEGQSQDTTSKVISSYFQEEKVQPFHYSSSIYYGGQDVYSRPQSAQNPGFTTFNKDGGEDDSGSASRGIGGRVYLLLFPEMIMVKDLLY